jgi:thioredoxin 1
MPCGGARCSLRSTSSSTPSPTAPALEAVAAELKGKVKVVKIDVDQNPQTTEKYRIRAMPTLMVFKDGKVAEERVGALVQKKQLTDWINGVLTA